jgi:dUTP pyrophosphatase
MTGRERFQDHAEQRAKEHVQEHVQEHIQEHIQERIDVAITRLPHGADLPLPDYQTALAAGLDLLAAVPADAPVQIAPGGRALVPTGVAIALPPGYEGQVRPRSGLAIRHGITVLNTPGTVDADYRGELQIILVNLGHDIFVVHRGMRIAQIIVAPVSRALLVETDALPATDRADGGFGSTGIGSQNVGRKD